MSPSSVSEPERRKNPRLRIASLAYICFESDDNGGVALNISEGGLCLRVIVPVETRDLVRLWIPVEGRRVELEAQVVWVDESRRTAGLRFKTLSPNSREGIRKWIYAPSALAPSPSFAQSGRVRLPTWLIASVSCGRRW